MPNRSVFGAMKHWLPRSQLTVIVFGKSSLATQLAVASSVNAIERSHRLLRATTPVLPYARPDTDPLKR